MRRNLPIYQGPGAPPTPEGWHAEKVSHHDPRHLCRWIDRHWTGGRIALVAHGTAGLLFRHAYLVANGDDDSREHRPWAGHVSRLVLLASPNRGSGRGRFRRGGPYVTDLRIRWVDHFDRTTDPVKVVQINRPSAQPRGLRGRRAVSQRPPRHHTSRSSTTAPSSTPCSAASSRPRLRPGRLLSRWSS